MIIVINPGHAPGGNPDPGAVSPSGTRESDITAAVSYLVSDYLQRYGYTAPVVQSDSLSEICSFANNLNADLFISIHCNAAENREANGAETFHAPGSERGERLARAIQIQIVNDLPVTNRGVKTAGYYVLTNTDMPAVLVELAFISNTWDEQLLIDTDRQADFASAIVSGILDYLGAE